MCVHAKKDSFEAGRNSKEALHHLRGLELSAGARRSCRTHLYLLIYLLWFEALRGTVLRRRCCSTKPLQVPLSKPGPGRIQDRLRIPSNIFPMLSVQEACFVLQLLFECVSTVPIRERISPSDAFRSVRPNSFHSPTEQRSGFHQGAVILPSAASEAPIP
jgi:hypothetical protein